MTFAYTRQIHIGYKHIHRSTPSLLKGAVSGCWYCASNLCANLKSCYPTAFQMSWSLERELEFEIATIRDESLQVQGRILSNL